MSNISKQDESYIFLAQVEAEKSQCRTQHGAIAVCSGKIIGRGYNDYRNRTKTSDGHLEIGCTCHAEMNAIRDIFKTFNYHSSYNRDCRRIDKILSNTKLYVARVSGNTYKYCESTPCSDCLAVIKRLNIKRIIHTINDNVKIVNNIEQYNNNHKSSARRFLSRITKK